MPASPQLLRLVTAPTFLFAFASAVASAQGATSYPAGCDASRVSKQESDRAHTLFLAGKQYLDESNYDKAISYFKDAYSIDCSVHEILPIIATAYERKGDRQEAVFALEEFLRRAPTTPDREKTERRIKNLRDQLASQVPAPTPVPAKPTPPTQAPAQASATARPSPPPPAPVAPVTESPQPEKAGGIHAWGPWALVGVGAAAAATGVVVYVTGLSKVEDAEKRCNAQDKSKPHLCAPGSEAAIADGNDGRTMEVVGVTVASVGGAAIVGGVLWYLLRPNAQTSTTGTTLVPVVSPTYGGASFTARF